MPTAIKMGTFRLLPTVYNTRDLHLRGYWAHVPSFHATFRSNPGLSGVTGTLTVLSRAVYDAVAPLFHFYCYQWR